MKHRFVFTSRRTAFTLVEMVVVVAVMGIMGSLVAINYGQNRRTARDTDRKSALATYKAGLESYRISNGTYFVTNLSAGPCIVKGDPTSDQAYGAGSGCTGANGLSFGKVNAAGTPADAPSNGHAQRTYGPNSIAQALQAGGYVSNSVKDPAATAPDDAHSPDIVYIRCCASGKESISQAGTIFALWTKLEGTQGADSTSVANSVSYCGGSSAVPFSGYRYDFGTDAADLPAATSFSVGNAIPKTQAAANLGSCQA